MDEEIEVSIVHSTIKNGEIYLRQTTIIPPQILLRYGRHPNIIELRDVSQLVGKRVSCDNHMTCLITGVR